MIVIALGVIAAMLFPVFQIFVNTERSRRITGNAFGFVVVVMGALAVYSIVRALTRPRSAPRDAVSGDSSREE
jgi:uncharacterized membrane protein YeaQ/YmgE (transglycosylase-associated protein family)